MEKHWSRGFTQHHLRELKELKKQMEVFISGAGFTLIELLIVIAVVGVLGTGVLVAIDPAGKINSANIAKAETFSASVQNNLAFDLVGEWTFDGNANDTSGYENITSIVGSGVALAPDRRNRGSKAYSLAGSGYINTGSGANLNITNAITIEGWIKLNQLGVENGIWGKGNYQWALTMQTGHKLEFQYTDGGGSY